MGKATTHTSTVADRATDMLSTKREAMISFTGACQNSE